MTRLPLRALMTHMIAVNCRTAFHLAIADRPCRLPTALPSRCHPFGSLSGGLIIMLGMPNAAALPHQSHRQPWYRRARGSARQACQPRPVCAPTSRPLPSATPKLQASSREDWRGMTQLTVAVGPDGAWHCPVPECTRSYMSYGAVQTHHKRAHTDGKPYSCKFGCDARFVYEDELAEHIKTHPVTPDWPFVCGCGRRYKKYSSLYCHVKASAMSQCKAVH
ncbi:hypothetical protein AURDEDRAFT_116759 [Auricularia subglabra TFB-10046 SS5]|uniref:C2H2-type domain-containing protein n=1 Tax=Auricularia subglabra (strain TFB-10046 / SS5) TaxID=717982 RepID=J0DAP4_AURST|nr:hypothetical protein AURDEDRAFT_116759 [Auricularia subglabra TFB-10046 SS5]